MILRLGHWTRGRDARVSNSRRSEPSGRKEIPVRHRTGPAGIDRGHGPASQQTSAGRYVAQRPAVALPDRTEFYGERYLSARTGSTARRKRRRRPDRSFRPRPADPLKRTLDILLSALVLLLASPARLIVPLAIRLEDDGPVIFVQERVGKGGRRFRSYKFWSMTLREHDGGAYRRAERDAARVTHVGRLLRPTALNELPQLRNVLKGDMSLVGPRLWCPRSPASTVAATGTVW